MGDEKKDIKNLLEVLDAAQGLVVVAIEQLKDGLSLDDIKILTANVGKLKTAVEGIGEVPEEIGDLDLGEVKELLAKAAEMVFAILAVLKKKLPKE